MIPRRSTRDAVYLKKKKKEKKILRIKRSRLEPGDGERALIKESFPAPPPLPPLLDVSRELCGPSEPQPPSPSPRKSHHHEPSFPSEKIIARSRLPFDRLFPRLRVVFTVSRPISPPPPPRPRISFPGGMCRCRCHPDPEKDRIFLTLH